MNLTGDLSPKALVEHTLESVLGERLIVHGARVIDIGSGAGFPGLPIAIVRGDLRFTLLEPRSKRSAFLRHVARELPLSNVEVLEARAADVGGQTYDVATVRAVGDPGDWALDTRILRPGGLFLAWTTSPQEIRRRLAPAFVLETSLRVPGSSSRVIASYRSL